MRIIIVGAGAVGSYLAERLSSDGQDVVVIEHLVPFTKESIEYRVRTVSLTSRSRGTTVLPRQLTSGDGHTLYSLLHTLYSLLSTSEEDFIPPRTCLV